MPCSRPSFLSSVTPTFATPLSHLLCYTCTRYFFSSLKIPSSPYFDHVLPCAYKALFSTLFILTAFYYVGYIYSSYFSLSFPWVAFHNTVYQLNLLRKFYHFLMVLTTTAIVFLYNSLNYTPNCLFTDQ